MQSIQCTKHSFYLQKKENQIILKLFKKAALLQKKVYKDTYDQVNKAIAQWFTKWDQKTANGNRGQGVVSCTGTKARKISSFRRLVAPMVKQVGLTFFYIIKCFAYKSLGILSFRRSMYFFLLETSIVMDPLLPNHHFLFITFTVTTIWHWFSFNHLRK